MILTTTNVYIELLTVSETTLTEKLMKIVLIASSISQDRTVPFGEVALC